MDLLLCLVLIFILTAVCSLESSPLWSLCHSPVYACLFAFVSSILLEDLNPVNASIVTSCIASTHSAPLEAELQVADPGSQAPTTAQQEVCVCMCVQLCMFAHDVGMHRICLHMCALVHIHVSISLQDCVRAWLFRRVVLTLWHLFVCYIMKDHARTRLQSQFRLRPKVMLLADPQVAAWCAGSCIIAVGLCSVENILASIRQAKSCNS